MSAGCRGGFEGNFPVAPANTARVGGEIFRGEPSETVPKLAEKIKDIVINTAS